MPLNSPAEHIPGFECRATAARTTKARGRQKDHRRALRRGMEIGGASEVGGEVVTEEYASGSE